MAIRKSTGIFHFTWLQQNLCCERPTRPTDIADYFLSLMIDGIYVILPTFYCSSGGCLSYRLHRNHNMTDNRFLYAFLLITLSTMCVLTPKLIFHFPIRFPPRLGHSMMITHFRVEYWKRVYRVSVASGLYKHNFYPALGPCVCVQATSFLLPALVVLFHFFRFMSHIRKKDDEIR